MSIADLPPTGDLANINHPRGLIIAWRAEADRFQENLNANAARLDEVTIRMSEVTIALLRRCAHELEQRLLWSGLS